MEPETASVSLNHGETPKKAGLDSKWRIYTDPYIENGETPTLTPTGTGVSTIVGTGYIYAPYIPLYGNIPPSEITPLAPLEEFVEEVFKEEIEEGKLTPIVREDATEFKISAAMRKKFKQIVINPTFFSPVKIENV